MIYLHSYLTVLSINFENLLYFITYINKKYYIINYILLILNTENLTYILKNGKIKYNILH